MAELISHEPATGAELWRGPIGDAAAEIAHARGAQPGWAALPLEVRAEALRRFANVVRGRAEAFADLIARETGKPLWEARGEVESVVAKVDISIDAQGERTPRRKLDGPQGARTQIRHKPHGVLAVLGPYNFPAHLPNGHIVPALLAGNAVVFKPSEKTPASGTFLVECLRAADIPAGVVRLLIGGRDEGVALAADPGVDGLLFTGSARAGLSLARAFAETPGRILALEMGGNNPLVVWDEVDLDAAAAIAVQSAFLSAGQRCTCARRLIVRDGWHEPLVERILAIVARLIVGAPHNRPDPFMGPLIDNAAADQVSAGYRDLLARGGKPLLALERPDRDLPFLTPALVDVTAASDVADEELFGPVLQLVRVTDFDAAIRAANATRYGLSASLVAGSPQLFDRFWAGVRAGVVNWNRPTNGAPSIAPFGGVGLSGNHRPSAWYAAHYCAYPVTSVEAEIAQARIGLGLREP